MYQSLTALDDFQKAAGSSIDMFADGADRAMGVRARTIMSNAQKATEVNNAISLLDDTSLRLGANFPDDIRDLVSFADDLDARFGTVSVTSLQGDIAKATTQGIQNALDSRSMTNKAVDAAAAQIEKMQGIDELAAMRSMENLLRRREPNVSPPRLPAPAVINPDAGLPDAL